MNLEAAGDWLERTEPESPETVDQWTSTKPDPDYDHKEHERRSYSVEDWESVYGPPLG